MPTKLKEDTAPMKTQVDILFQLSLTNKEWFLKMALDPSKRFLAVALNDGRVLILDLHSSEDPMDMRCLYLQGKKERQGCVRDVCFSPNGKFLISVCSNGTVFKYNIKSSLPDDSLALAPDDVTLETEPE